MDTVVAVEFGVPGWDGSKKKTKGGYRFRDAVENEDRGTRVKAALTRLHEISLEIEVKPRFVVFPGTTFGVSGEVRRSGIESSLFPVLYEAPNPVHLRDPDDERKDRVYLHNPRWKSSRNWLQGVVTGADARVSQQNEKFRCHDLVSDMISEMPDRIAKTGIGAVLPVICGEVGTVPMHREGSHGAHYVTWPKVEKYERLPLRPFLELWRNVDIIVNPSHTTMAAYNDRRRRALSKNGKLFVGIANVGRDSPSTSLRVYANGKERNKRPVKVTDNNLQAVVAARVLEKRGDVFGVEIKDGKSVTRFWFVRS